MSSMEQPYILYDSFNSGQYVLGSSETHSHKIDFYKPIRFNIVQSYPRQDHTPRIWLSRVPRDIAITWGGPVDFINIKKTPYTINLIDSTDKKLYKDLYTFLITPGTYFLNVQNLENYGNGYTLFL